MSLFHSPSLVTSGLVLCLDAGNSKSYPGSGTAWTDLSGNGYNGTLTNGSIFRSQNYGVIDFNSNSLATANGLIGFNFESAITISFWHYNDPASSGNYRGVVCAAGCYDFRYGTENNGTNLYASVLTTNSAFQYFILTSALATWGYNTMIYNGSSLSIYRNDAITGSMSVTGSLGSPSSSYIGANGGGGERLIGNLGVVTLYNRALSAAEVKQNFNALRGRYRV